jgi:PAS domain S-box-containing protein
MEGHDQKVTDKKQPTRQALQKEIYRLLDTIADLEAKLMQKTAAEQNNEPFNLKHKQLSDFAAFAIASLSDGGYLISKDARIVYVNPAACKQLGYTEEELLSMRIMDIDPNVTEENWGSIRGVTVRDKIQTIETEHLTKDGRLIPVEVVANYIEINGEQYSFSFARDITERKKAEEALKKNQKELQKRVKELEEFYEMAVGRELRMKQLKEESEKLKVELEKYKKS